VQNGACRMTRGSLGEVLPASVKALFARAAADADADRQIVWTAQPSQMHRFFVPAPASEPRSLVRHSEAAPPVDDFTLWR
jgi:hypothetical protein